MKRKLLMFFTATSLMSMAQTELHFDDFETNGTFIMATGGYNGWLINNAYTGGTILMGLVTIPAVPAQPATFSVPNGKYLHPASSIATTEGVNNSSYYLDGSGTKVMAAMTGTVNTTGYENVTVKFWRTGGSAGMKLLYKVNGGTWTDSGFSFTGNPTTWGEYSIAIPAGDNVNQFSVAFEFDEALGIDPAPNHYHSIDELRIVGDVITTGATMSTTLLGAETSFCGQDTITVDYSGTGTYNAGNEFQLELSDDAGDFTSATVIGSITSTLSTGTIEGYVPMSVVSGTGYRVRVVSTDVAMNGTDNGTDLSMNPMPVPPVIVQSGGQLTSDYATGNQWYLDGTPISGATGQTYNATTGGTYTVVHTSSAGCSSYPSAPAMVDFTSLESNEGLSLTIFPNPFGEELNVSNSSSIESIKMIDVTGKVVFEETINDSKFKLNTASFQKGIYFLQITNGKEIKTVKVIKK